MKQSRVVRYFMTALVLLSLSMGMTTASAANADWIFNAKWGIWFDCLKEEADQAALDARLNSIDAHTYANTVEAAQVGFVVITVQQTGPYSVVPNPYTQFHSTRDLVADFYDALNPKGIKILLYQAVDKYDDATTVDLLTYYSNRFGDRIIGWFLDGAGGKTPAQWQAYVNATKAGNPDSLVHLNTGNHLGNGHGEMLAGEEGYDALHLLDDFYPEGGSINGEIPFMTTYMSQWYGRDGNDSNYPDPTHARERSGPRYTTAQMVKAATDYIRAGGVFSLDVPNLDNGQFFPGYLAQLNALGSAISNISTRKASPRIKNIVEDTDGAVTYSSNWTAYFPPSNNPGLPSANSGSSEHITNIAGSWAQYTFNGNSIQWVTRTAENGATANVYIDGVLDATVSTSTATQVYQNPVYTKTGLSSGNHTIRVESTNGGVLVIDGFIPGKNPSPSYEAESASRSGGANVNTNHAGYSGTGFVDAMGSIGAAASFGVYVPADAMYQVTLRYANATASAQTLSVYVNGRDLKQTSLPPLANWDTWGSVAETFILYEGYNTIQYKHDSSDSGLVNLDKIEVAITSATTISHSQMTATATSAQNQGGDGPASWAIDDNPATFWHSQYSPMQNLPQSVTLSLGGTYTINRLRYLPRQTGSNGTATSYNIYVSSDGINFALVKTGAWAMDSSEKTASFSSVSASHVKFEITAAYGGFASAAEINIEQDPTLPQSQMTATATSAQNQGGDGPASWAIDGNPATFWHSQYSPMQNLPQSVTLNLGGTYTINRLRYLPRQTGSNGTATGYNIYVSSDGMNFTLVNTGTWVMNSSEKVANLSAVSASHVKLEITAAYGGFASAAEVNVEALLH